MDGCCPPPLGGVDWICGCGGSTRVTGVAGEVAAGVVGVAAGVVDAAGVAAAAGAPASLRTWLARRLPRPFGLSPSFAGCTALAPGSFDGVALASVFAAKISCQVVSPSRIAANIPRRSVNCAGEHCA